MGKEPIALPTRRGFLVGAGAAVFAWAAHAFGRAEPVQASHGGSLALQHRNTQTSKTALDSWSDDVGLEVDQVSERGVAVYGYNGGNTEGTGVYGASFATHEGFLPPGPPGNTGVFGWAGWHGGRGVRGDSQLGNGVYGSTYFSSDAAAVLGHSQANGTGVQGYSGGTSLPGPAPRKTGVHGYAVQDATSRGVHGQTTAGRGVEATATTGIGVLATSRSGTAVQSFSDTNGWALRTTRGHVGFSTSGLATIAAGTSRVRVVPGFDIRPTSKVLAVLQGNPGGSTSLRFVTRDVLNDAFTIQLSANATADTAVAWFVIS
jgi:hypothetical protein